MTGLLHWSRAERVGASRMLAAAVGLATPVVVGALTGHVAAGMTAAMGGLSMAEVGDTGSAAQRAGVVLRCLVAVMLAVVLGTYVTRAGVAGALAMIAAAAISSAVGSTSREAAKASMKFTIFMALATFAPWPNADAAAMVGFFGAGALWAGAVALVLSGAFHLVSHATAPPAPAGAVAVARPWRQRLAHAASKREAWSYTVRLVAALAVAQAARPLWPSQHSYWIVVTAALVVTRATSGTHLRALQRALGTLAGVVAGTLLLAWHAPTWAVLAAIALIAGLRPLLKARNYLAYSAVMTPLVVMLLEFGRSFDPAIMLERLLATLAGCAIAMAADFLAPATPRARD